METGVSVSINVLPIVAGVAPRPAFAGRSRLQESLEEGHILIIS